MVCLRSLWRRIRSWKRPACPAPAFAVLAAALAVLLNNHRLFALTRERLEPGVVRAAACLLAIFVVLTGLVALFLLLAGWGRALKPLAIATLLVSATLAYFTEEFGTVFDVGMIRNVAEAAGDRNKLEAAELLSGALVLRLFVFGALPSALLLLVRVSPASWRRELRSRALHAGGLAALAALLILPNFRYLTYFSREHPTLRFYATPTFAVNSLVRYLGKTSLRGSTPFVEIGTDAVRHPRGASRVVGILVVGETARADHFSLNGYPRKTNPRLERRPLLNYPDVRSSGTSTAYSVPYLFSFLGKRGFTPERARGQSNALDVLSRAGVQVVWIENNSGHKGVGERLDCVQLRSTADPASPLYSDGGYYDEALLEEVERRIDATSDDLLFVLHTMGSHGPAYHRRYPPAFGVFQPACTQDTPQRAAPEEVVNAYDNTIVYTDYVLDRLITLLESREEPVAPFLLYVSDHGESLGENGIYLHGLPEALAPVAQVHIPMLLWISPRLLDERRLPFAALQAGTGARRSHDHVPHTMLGLFGVETALYRPELDLLR